jgi:hypothetical protein
MGVITVNEFTLGKTQGIKLMGENKDLKKVAYYHYGLVNYILNDKQVKVLVDTLNECNKDYLYVYDIKSWNKVFTELRLHLAIDGIQLKKTKLEEIPF